MIENVSTTRLGAGVSPSSSKMNSPRMGGLIHRSQSPAMQKNDLSFIVNRNGVRLRADNYHSKNPSATTKHRWNSNGFLKLVFSETVSARALISLSPMLSSFALPGITP